MPEKMEEREQWGSRAGFIFASVGAAVGFGNIWRFPSLAYSFGGGAFFIPYLMALIFIGIPLVILEIALGQYYRTGDIGVFGGIHARMRGVGVASLVCGFSVVLYYIPLIAWTVRAFFESFKDFDKNYTDSNGKDAYAYFKDDIIGMSTLGVDNLPTRVVWENFGCLVFIYALIFLCVGFGVKNTGRIAYFTMGFPILLLFIFLIRVCVLEGAGDGIKAYIGEWDMSVLSKNGNVWSLAVSQIFFSLGVTFGIFTAYGSSCPKDAPVLANSFVISLANTAFSFISGFVVFAALGHLAFKSDLPVSAVADAGPGLVFGTYPVVLADLDGGQHWVRLFFIFLFLLGIDSGFGLFEGVLIVLNDTVLGEKYSKMQLAGALCGVGILCGLLFVTDAGFIFLDVVDYYVNFILILVGFFEVFGAGWIFGIEEQIEKIGKIPVFLYMFTTFGSLTFASIFWFGLNDNQVWAGFVALIVSYIAGMIGVYISCIRAAAEKNMELNDVFYTLSMEYVIVLKDRLSTNIGPLPTVWAFSVKHMMPSILLICFINLCASKQEGGRSVFAHYGNYVAVPYQIIGIAIVILTMFVFVVGVTFPNVYHMLVRSEISDYVNELNQGKISDGEKVEVDAEIATQPALNPENKKSLDVE